MKGQFVRMAHVFLVKRLEGLGVESLNGKCRRIRLEPLTISSYCMFWVADGCENQR